MFPGIFQTARSLPKRRHLSCRRILLPLQASETWLTLGYIFLRLLCSERIFWHISSFRLHSDDYSPPFHLLQFIFIQSAPVANRLIEVSSPRLHYGRAAFYGSTIVPLRIIALHGCRPRISAHGSARPSDG